VISCANAAAVISGALRRCAAITALNLIDKGDWYAMRNTYESPLASRYASQEMLYIFSPDKKFSTWRQLWIALARAEMELGLINEDGTPTITPDMIEEMEAHVTDIDYEMAAQEEKKLRHDVMAHVHTFGHQCPKAAGIIHLGATSCYVGDNTDIIQMREGLKLVRNKLVQVLSALGKFAERYKALPTLGFTHFQAAQMVTVGKRATLWMNELLMDLEEVEYRIDNLKLLGSKGTTGTQASFMELFDGDTDKIKALEQKIAAEMGFAAVVPVSGQTYSRKVDAAVLATLSGIAQSASKFATDVRLLCHMKEIEEPFERNQIGSSAMPYKRNPMRSERICSLARYVIADAINPAVTSATQWFERTLDDSANKRISVPEAFLAIDAILNIYLNVASGLIVHEKVIAKHIQEELPFMASENIMMDAVRRGGDRQVLHEEIRKMSIEAGHAVKDEGKENNLLELIAQNPMFGMTLEELSAHMDPSLYIGRCPQQVDEFLNDCIRPVLERYPEALDAKAVELTV
jgi:adenylosuccinate lyase